MVAKGEKAMIRGAAKEVNGDGFEKVVGVVCSVNCSIMCMGERF